MGKKPSPSLGTRKMEKKNFYLSKNAILPVSHQCCVFC